MEKTPRGNAVHPPDLNWSQVSETVRMLELAALQIEAAMKDGNASVDVLGQSFTTLAEHLKMVSQIADTLPDDGPTGEAKRQLAGASEHAAGMVRQTIIAFQFYDKLVQRLSHVGLSLGELSQLVGDRSRLSRPDEWVALQQRIKAKYSTAEEIAMFTAVMQGMPVQEAITKFMADWRGKSDDIELF
ncbi:hypothetical protein [Azonexus sp.]|uniref:hypothetical protein n=1 Tax=Azonexus sp. TaxID=1872668 RepID=UPI00282EE2DC|nr:hypothetical protein [Azonexus sp.]MDR1995673.1 hypothetical protein [Azonexus sp.]